MDATFFMNVISAGLLTGLVYGLMALGLSVIFGVMRVVNFAHGDMMVVAMYAAFLLFTKLGIEPVPALPLVAGGLFVVGYLLQRFLINHFLEVTEHIQFLLLLSVAMIITNVVLMVFGPDARNIQLDASFESYSLGGLVLDKVRVIAAFTAGGVALLLWAFFRYTTTGTAIRACADNPVGARVVGLDVEKLYAITFGIGTACVGAAGCLLLLLVDVHPHLSSDYTLLGFIIVILGGLGSLGGALLGGILVGLSEALSGVLIAPSLKSMFSFGLLILVLLLRPQGILGKKP
ncbi:branched chain amino acid ABC transporter [Paramagnetospirillum caucaseum]|uniref:Branched chain amino acid ABC transporter n=1 Tax=Paramagnetospirillum caucaseum TaxID=1244869 RepID=M2YDL2_9PROT|nr:branched-chain amino acid ABC transporter permease [Paramagnetospirillum caucaseum]EME71056.1 branched chain amino acid ABC transporter [Paramagnetospirillum caucaseum]